MLLCRLTITKQRTCLEQTRKIGLFTAKLCVINSVFRYCLQTSYQNTATASSDEEEDLNRLEAMESKLLMYDPAFKQEHTYSAINSQKSALMSAFKPKYGEGDTAGEHAFLLFWTQIRCIIRQRAYTS